MPPLLLLFLVFGSLQASPIQDTAEKDGDASRKILGSSVVTSVSVIMDSGHGSQTYFADAVGKPVSKPQTGAQLASPINLLNPDRYEFFTFDDNGELIKRLMTLEEIQGIIANGDGEESANSETYLPQKKVNDIVSTVQNVLKEEIKSRKNNSQVPPILDTPDVSSTWSMILPAIFGNSGEDITPDKTQTMVTPETIMVENAKPPAVEDFDAIKFETHGEEIKPVYINIPEVETKKPDDLDAPIITVDVITNKPNVLNDQVDTEATKNVERLPLNKTKITTTTTQAPNFEANKVAEVAITKNQQITTTQKITSIAEEIKAQEQTTPKTSESVNGNSEEIVKAETTTISSTAAETTPQLVPLISTVRPAPFTIVQLQAKPLTASPKPLTASPKPTKKPTISNLQDPSTAQPIQFLANEEVNAPVKTQAEETLLESSTEVSSITSSAVIEESVTNEPFDQIEPDTDDKPAQNPPDEIQVTASSVLIGSTPTPMPISISSLQSVETTTATAPILLIIQENVKGTANPETSTSGFLSTFFFVDDGNKNKHQTTPLPSEETPTPSPSSQITITDNSLEESTSKYTTPSNDFKPTTSKDQVTTLHVEIEQTTQNQLKETSKLPMIVFDAQKEEDEETKQASTHIQILPEKNEQITQKPISIIQDTTTKGPLVYDLDLKPTEESDITTTSKELTTQNPVTSSKQVVTEALGQFLLSSTNIYEINSQLANAVNDSSLITELPQDITTEQSLISSIEQLISQAVGNDENPSVFDVDDIKKVEEVLDNTKNKTMEDMQAEIATVASVLLDKTTTDNSLRDENLQLSEAVGSLLSQVSDAFPLVNGTMESLLQVDFGEIPANLNNISIGEPVILTDKISSTEKTPDGEKPNEEVSTEKINLIGEKPNEEVSTEKINLIDEIVDKMEAPEMVYEEIDIQKLMDEIKLMNDSNKTETTKNTTDKIDAPVNVTESIGIKTNEETLINNVQNKNNEIKTPENATKIPITETVSIQEDKLELTKLENNLTKEKIDGTKVTGVSESHSSKIKVRPANDVKPQTSTEKVNSVYDVITSTAKYSTSSLLTPSANNVVKTVDSNAPILGGNYKMETATEVFGTLTTKNKINSGQDITLEDRKNSTWTLVPTVLPHSNVTFAPVAPKPTMDNLQPPTPVKLSPHPVQGFGLEDSTSRLDTDIYQFVELCNELAFGFWSAVTTGISSVRSIFVSPFAATSLLAMVFLGARGSTSGEMNEILKLDDMVTFNPHLIFKNVSESIEVSKNAGVAASVIARELFSDRNKGKLLNFYKDRAKQFYDGHVEEVNFKEIGDIIRRRTNLLIKKYTWGKIQEYMKDGSITVRPPLAGVSASVFQTDCSGAFTQGRDGELYFVVLPSVRQRRLIPIPSAVWRSGFLAGYDPSLDATAAAIGTQDQTVSVIFVIPGQQGISAPGDGLSRLEKRLVDSSFKQGSWSRLLRTLIPRPGLELQIPRFSHKSVINATVALKNMGLKDLFSYDKADLKGLNGASHELHLSDILQINNFVMCGEVPIGDNHHVEIYPATAKRPSRRSRKLELRLFSDPDLGEEPRDYQRAFNDPLHDPDLLTLPLSMRPRQARIPDAPRLRFDRPFLFFVRHNPTGLILHMGRFNPRLLP